MTFEAIIYSTGNPFNARKGYLTREKYNYLFFNFSFNSGSVAGAIHI
jgi:hypothetical protein